MDHSFSLGELIQKIPLSLADSARSGEQGELHATLSAHYAKQTHEVVAELDGYVCPDDASHMMDEHLRPAWLPAKQTVCAGGDEAETSDIARDIFHSWLRQVRDAVPPH